MRTRLGRREEKLTRLTFRAPASLHDSLTRAAQESNRSLNHEIISRLEASIELDRILKTDSPDDAALAMINLQRLKHYLESEGGEK